MHDINYIMVIMAKRGPYDYVAPFWLDYWSTSFLGRPFILLLDLKKWRLN